MDGQQRLLTIREFFDNEFALRGLETWPGINGRRYQRLPPRIQAGLQRRSIPAVILLPESQPEIKRIVFERLNTGGVRLNAQEIRNVVYDGPFNRLLHEISSMPLFRDVWGIPTDEGFRKDRLYRQMLDCEIVLRFFTLREPQELSTSMKKSLDETMHDQLKASPKQIRLLKSEYLQCLDLAQQIYGEGTFRRLSREGTQRRALSRGLYDAVMVALSRIQHSAGSDREATRSSLLRHRRKIVTATEALMKRRGAYRLLVGSANTKKAIVERIDLLSKVYENALAG
jgi:hypothetical protein